MRKRLHVTRRLLLALMPATLITVAAATLLAVLVVLPSFSGIDFLRADRSVPGAAEGALLIIDQIDGGSVAEGDVVVVASLAGDEPVMYAVSAIDGGFATLSQSVGEPTLTLPQADLSIRVTRSIAGFGDAYEFVDSVPGWITVIGSAVLAWVVALGLLGWRRRRGHPSISTGVAASPAPPPLAAVPILQRPPLQQQHTLSGHRAPAADARDYAPQHDAANARAGRVLPRAGNVFDLIARDLARPAPQRWLQEIQSRGTFRPANESVRWAGLGAVAAVVASATLLVAEESYRRQARRRHLRQPAPKRGLLARLF